MKVLKICLICLFLSLAVLAQNKQDNKIEKLSFCNLTANPIKYHGKKIQLAATFFAFIETTHIGTIKNCSNDEQMNVIGVEFDKDWKENTKKKTRKKFKKYLRVKYVDEDGRRKVNFVSTGYFSCSSKKLFENRFSCYINILKIDSVKKNHKSKHY